MPTPRLVVIGCGFPQLGLLQFCSGLDVDVIGVDMDPGAIGRAYCDEFLELSTTDAEGIAEAARSLGVDGVTTGGSEHALMGAAAVCETLGLPFYTTPERVQLAHSKAAMRQALTEAGVPCPAYAVVEQQEQVEEFADSHGLPVVLKPTIGWGQRGVSVVAGVEEIPAAFHAARTTSRDLGDVSEVVVEEFARGKEYSVNAFTHDGQTRVFAVAERTITEYPAPHGISLEELAPPDLNEAQTAELVDATRRGIDALGIELGPSYSQVIYGPDGPQIIEIAHRTGGGFDPDIAELASGVSTHRKLVGIALERPAWLEDEADGQAHGAVIGKFLVAEPGRLVEVHGLDQARALEGVVDARVYCEPGDIVDPLADGSKRAGHILAVGESREEARRRAHAAAELITFEVRDLVD